MLANPTLMLCAIAPLDELTLSYGRWGSARACDMEGERRTIQNDASAQERAKLTTPHMSVITRLAVRLAVEIAPGPSRQVLLPTERSFVECLGGQTRCVIEFSFLAMRVARSHLPMPSYGSETDRKMTDACARHSNGIYAMEPLPSMLIDSVQSVHVAP